MSPVAPHGSITPRTGFPPGTPITSSVRCSPWAPLWLCSFLGASLSASTGCFVNSTVRSDWTRTVANSGGPAVMEGHIGTAAESAAGLGFLWHDHPSPSNVQADQSMRGEDSWREMANSLQLPVACT